MIMGAEVGMLIVETIAKIRRAFFVQGKPIKAICRELRVSRKVVRKVLRSEATEFRYEREAQPLPKIGPWRDKSVVVYKVDRLTRSLSDFAKIVDVLDAHNASFVSVTQQFNTTTSMGRLTLNMLLSFAQFEREIAGERIRDKI